MTDHYIQRNKPARNLLAPFPELHDTEQTGYKGEVVLLYPPRLAATGENELYLAVAQVAEGANLKAGIPRLQKAIRTYRPPEGEFYFFLADAYRQNGQNEKAEHFDVGVGLDLPAEHLVRLPSLRAVLIAGPRPSRNRDP